jgi:hypothetical protein
VHERLEQGGFTDDVGSGERDALGSLDDDGAVGAVELGQATRRASRVECPVEILVMP